MRSCVRSFTENSVGTFKITLSVCWRRIWKSAESWEKGEKFLENQFGETWITMFKFVFVLFITVLCTYLVFSSTSPNSSEHSSTQSGIGHQENSESLLLIQDFFVKSYEYVQHYFTLIFVENQFQEAGEAIYQDILGIFKHLEEYIRSIDYNSVVSRTWWLAQSRRWRIIYSILRNEKWNELLQT